VSTSPHTESAAPDRRHDGGPASPGATTTLQNPRSKLSLAYPRLEFSRRSRNWWAWLKGTPPECVHLDREAPWTATLLPDTLYLRGKRSLIREPARPEVSLCRECLIDTVASEFAAYAGKVVAFEPDAEAFTQYFFLGAPDFERAGLKPEVSRAIELRLPQEDRTCGVCGQAGTWLWFSREEVASLDEVERIREAPGESFCAEHGSEKLCRAFESISEANLFYMNLPYGKAGAYVWI
jgi:hypothetical protein